MEPATPVDPAGIASPAPAAAFVPGEPLLPPARRRRWVLVRRLAIWLAAAAVLAGAALAAQALNRPPDSGTSSANATPGPRLVARGEVQPVAQAKVAATTGGVVLRLNVRVGDAVEEQQELARIRNDRGVEVLAAPWAGTITTLPASTGDTVTPGTVVATVGDLTRFQVQTTDVDEFLVPSIHAGQPVRLTADALGERTLHGYVRSVALVRQTGRAGDDHFPVLVDLVETPPELRQGMTIRVDFAPEG
jgi:multidrug efflux pump subunit AcrA (membrane-fusion protein)